MISGAELFVKALKAEHVDTIFAYPGGQAIDLFDALYGEKSIHVILRAMNRAWFMRPTDMPVPQKRPGCAW